MELALLGRQPVLKDRPAGRDIKYDTEFDELHTEVANAVSVSGGDWEKIVKLSSEILSQKSKDLIVAGYLAVGLIHTQKTKGLMIGTDVYLDLIENYWNDLYPSKERLRGRSRAIEWWAEKTAATLRTLGRNALTQQEADTLCARLEKTHTFLQENLEDCPSFRPMIDAAHWIVAAAEPIEAPDTRPSAAVTPERSAASTDIVTDKDAATSLMSLAEQARKTAAYFQSQDIANPLAYRLNRFAMWANVNELPPVDDGRTLLAQPESALIERLAFLQDNGDTEALIKFAEEEAFQHLFWLDLHRVSAAALQMLGDTHAAAAETVLRETAGLIARLPGLETLEFSDGQPFADPETRQWLRGAVKEATHEAPAVSLPATDENTSKIVAEIKKLLKGKKITEATKRYQAGLQALSSGRAKFLLKLEFASALSKTKEDELLSIQLDQIVEDLNRHQLDAFDPQLALSGLTLALNAYRADGSPDAKKKAKETLYRISKIDMSEFIRQEQKN